MTVIVALYKMGADMAVSQCMEGFDIFTIALAATTYVSKSRGNCNNLSFGSASVIQSKLTPVAGKHSDCVTHIEQLYLHGLFDNDHHKLIWCRFDSTDR